MEPIIKVEGLTHIYSVGTPFEHIALENVDFEAYAGECIAIIGHTGSGKSTFIQHLNGLLEPTSGIVKFKGTDINSSKKFRYDTRFKVGIVFQYPEYQLFEETIYKDIAFGPKNMKLPESEIDKRVRETAEIVGIDESLLDESPFEISGGQKRRVAIAGVMAMRPEVIIFDEPTSGLDPKGRKDITECMMRYKEKENACIIMVSHSMEDAANLADRIYVFNHGKIEITGTPSDVFSNGSRLEEIGLTVPQVTKIAMQLRKKGISISEDIYTLDSLKNELIRLREGDVRA